MDSIKINTSQNIDIEYEIAGLGERIAARCIDLAGFVVLGGITMVLMGVAQIGMSGNAALVVLFIFFAIFAFYDLVCELTMNGQTFGKKVLKIKVVSLDGTQPTFGQYLLRWIFRIIDFGFPLGWGVIALASVAITESHQRLGDLLAKTTLIKTTPRTQLENVAFSFTLPEEYQPQFKEVLHLNDRDVELIHEVLTGYYQTGNPDLIYAMAAKTKAHIFVTIPAGMNELQFLEAVLKDYNHITSSAV
ncbi:RDD family protein [Pedobacter frigidisoli]|uniref:RDD family protein n=1 Tax=Pedobacter frigidisoli TaxID=2530455 RepID=A0A4R0PAC7_9SPHI|nr:RDD family protein [Pedobacter frigidisoli]TCD12798.1 RDD family protein [Pedobacter frigidisoli]